MNDEKDSDSVQKATAKMKYMWRVLATVATGGIIKVLDYYFTLWQTLTIGSLGANQLDASAASYVQFMMFNKFVNGASLMWVFIFIMVAVWWKPVVNVINQMKD
jgi:hypothetical protein